MLLPALLLLAACAAVFLWPQRGILARSRRKREFAARVRREDCLKHILKMETASRRPTLESVAGAVHLEPDAAAALLRNLELRGLVTYASGDLRLTPDGRSRAAQVIRAHRLWETHLAEDTGIGETEWHALAEQQEHSISPAEADALAARLSHPTHDPHGDPIPSAEGDLAAESGQALNTLAPGSVARIIHIEDEPAVLYSQLVAMNLRAGMTVRVAESGSESLRFSADGAMHEIAPMLAHQIEVILLADGEAAESSTSLADYPPGRRVTVRGLARGARGPERRRLLDLGFVAGTGVEVEMVSPSGEPTAYLVRGTLIALHREQARWVLVEPAEALKS